MINSNKIRSFYRIPSDWRVDIVDRTTNDEKFQFLLKTIENAELMAFDTETMPSFYESFRSFSMVKPSLLQVAIRSVDQREKHVFIFDLQTLFNGIRRTSICQILTDIFQHRTAQKLSHSFFNDLAQLKCSFDESCFQKSKIERVIELSKIFREKFPEEKFSLQNMTSIVLNCHLNKKEQCSNWSKRPLTQSMKDYAAIDVIVMIDIYDRLCSIDKSNSISTIETSIDLDEIVVYSCVCHQRFLTSKTRTKHEKICVEKMKKSNEFDLAPLGRGYLPPALKRVDQIRSSTDFFDRWTRHNENRPPDAEFFLQDDDKEVAQAFGFQSNEFSSKKTTPPVVYRPKSNPKVAAFPPRKTSTENFLFNQEKQLLERLKVDIDSQPDFHCHLFGLGGRGRCLDIDQSPPSPQFTPLTL